MLINRGQSVPEIHLMVAVLELAVSDMEELTAKPNPQNVTWTRSRQELLNWFYSRSEQDLSFRGICILVDLDPGRALEHLAGKIAALKAAEKLTPNPGSRPILLGGCVKNNKLRDKQINKLYIDGCSKKDLGVKFGISEARIFQIIRAG